MAQPARTSRTPSRNGALNRRGTSAVATETTAASLARICAGIISSNVKRLRRRATIQPRRRRSHRQEDDRRAIMEVGGFAGNSGIGRPNKRCVRHRSRHQLEQAGWQCADTHHAAAGRLTGMAFHARMIDVCAGIVGHRHGTVIMVVTGMTLMSRRHVRQAMQHRCAAAECKSGDRHENAKGIQRDENARRVDPCCSGQPFQHSEPASNDDRADCGRSTLRNTVRLRHWQAGPGT